MNIEFRYGFGCKLVRGNTGRYSHTFGGELAYAGTIPEGCSAPVHLLYRLDLTDPALPFRIDCTFRFLPLFHAFSYDAEPMSYRVCADDEIEILGIDNCEVTPEFPYTLFPRSFPSVPVDVQPITYEEQRDLAMFWYLYSHAEIDKAIPQEEIQRFRSLGYPVARIGPVHDLIQLPRGEVCPNPACKHHDESHWLQTIATIPERPFPELDLWQADGPTIQIVYEICKLCGTIRTYNTCD